MARRSLMKRQPTTWGSSPWQQVERPFRMAGRRTCLTNLIHVSHEMKDGLIFAALIDERFAATEGGAGFAQEIQDESFGLLRMDLAIGLFFGQPAPATKRRFESGRIV